MPLLYFAEVNILCISILVLILFSAKQKGSDDEIRKLFDRLLLSGILLLLADLFWGTVEKTSLIEYEILNKVANAIYFSISGTIGYSWLMYAEAIQQSKIYRTKWLRRAFLVPCVLLAVVSIASVWTEWLFYIDEEGIYRRGGMFWLHIVCAYGIAAFASGKALIKSFSQKDAQIKREYLALAIFMIPPLIMEIIQLIVPEISTLCIGLAVSAVYIYIRVQNRMTIDLLEKQKESADAANQAKSTFLAHMSHEIRTPINAVLGLNEIILREAKDEEIQQLAIDMSSATHGLLTIINDILDFSKIESGKMEIIEANYYLSSLIHDLEVLIQARMQSKKQKLVIEVDENLPSVLYGDEIRIRQILVNLLTNAVKYTPEGTITLRFKGYAVMDRVILHVEVIDTGIGIKPEDIERLYVAFERIEKTRNRNIEGTGLGMNITAQLLNLMGSSLQVKSEYGKGSCFSFRLEQKIIDAQKIGKFKKTYREESAGNELLAPDVKVLIVDDNFTNRMVFRKLLKKTQIQVTEADSGQACLDFIQRERFDMIFLDHMMPELDGIETFHRMEELPDNQCKDVPIIMLTANAMSGAEEQYLEEGFHGFLEKPIIPNKLEKIIREQLKI